MEPIERNRHLCSSRGSVSFYTICVLCVCVCVCDGGNRPTLRRHGLLDDRVVVREVRSVADSPRPARVREEVRAQQQPDGDVSANGERSVGSE